MLLSAGNSSPLLPTGSRYCRSTPSERIVWRSTWLIYGDVLWRRILQHRKWNFCYSVKTWILCCIAENGGIKQLNLRELSRLLSGYINTILEYTNHVYQYSFTLLVENVNKLCIVLYLYILYSILIIYVYKKKNLITLLQFEILWAKQSVRLREGAHGSFLRVLRKLTDNWPTGAWECEKIHILVLGNTHVSYTVFRSANTYFLLT